jgi:hypothetical protein
VLIEETTDAGVTGVGEAVGWPTPEVALAVLDGARSVVVSCEAFAIGALESRCGLPARRSLRSASLPPERQS